MTDLTPMMQQYMEIKKEYKDCILLFRLGDFYEMFFEDAKIASKELEIALTGRDCGQAERAPMCGVPYHSVDPYISKLISKGYKVAICEQTEEPAQAKGIVKRDVVRVVTPGTVTDTKILKEKENNYLSCIYKGEKGIGISLVDVTTGELKATELTIKNANNKIINELARYYPSEIIGNQKLIEDETLIKQIKERFACDTEHFFDWSFEKETASQKIMSQLKTLSLSATGLEDKENAIKSVGALLEYLEQTQKISLSHIMKINYYHDNEYMNLDISTRRNLELTETMREKAKKGSLLWVMDRTKTAMGGRLLKQWIEQPLLNYGKINNRLMAVDELLGELILRDELIENFKKIYDIERLLSKIIYGSVNCRDLISLKNSIYYLPQIKNSLSKCTTTLLANKYNELDTLEDIYEIIEKSIIDEPPFSIREGGLIKEGYNEQVDKLRHASKEGKHWLAQLESKEKEKTGIKNLKIGYNRVFGYYIEVTKANISNVPERYIRKQTLANSERYFTPELKEIENTILGAEEKIIALEYEIFTTVRDKIGEQTKRIQESAQIIAKIDVLSSLAEVAQKNNYCMPQINTSDKIIIKDGRHPVVEKMMDNNMFVPNDTQLDNNENRLSIITGPNMAGKSTYMRQVALITLMTQIGSFVPASSAKICIVDKIFTRVGASDDLAAGQSTFMVEMNEVANILNNAGKKSLLILDEIGRGTSTYDGLSIAWSVIEYISNTKKIGAKTLFATHYHELTELENKLNGVKNYCIAVKKRGDDITFIRKIIRGGADDSYGIEVAKLAGVPEQVIIRAKEILDGLEKSSRNENTKPSKNKTIEKDTNEDKQIELFQIQNNKIIEELKQIEITSLTPIEAMNILYKLQKKITN